MENQLFPFLQSYWQKVIDDLVQSLKDVNRYASGVTAQEIGAFNVTPVKFISSELIEVTIAMPEYYKFIDEGVSGAKKNTNISRYKYTNKMPPISAIRKFMLNRGIVSRDFRQIRSSKGRGRNQSIDKSLNRLAYAIAYSIWQKGIKPTNFYTDVIDDELLTNFEKQLLDQYGKLVMNIIDVN